MFKKIGTGETGAPLVLCELNKDEREALELILIEAQRGWDTNRRRYGTRRGLLLKMTMDGLREEFGIEPPAPSPDREDSPAHDAHSATFITAVQERHPGLEVGLISEPED